MCCGVKELNRLSDYNTPRSALEGFGTAIYNVDRYKETGYREHKGEPLVQRDNFRYAVFTCAWSRSSMPKTYGQGFADYIIKHNLGEVIETGVHINPNSNNNLKVWLWTVDHDAVRKHLNMPKPKDANAAPFIITPVPSGYAYAVQVSAVIDTVSGTSSMNIESGS